MSATRDEGYFNAQDGLRLHFQTWNGGGKPRAILAVVHGYLEHGGRYGFLVDHFVPRGYPVYVFDHRGHGRSMGRRAFVSSFSDYLEDVDRYLATIQAREGSGHKTFLVGHSLGGLVSLRYAIESPEGLAGVVASSPYLGNKVPVSPGKLWAAKVLSRVAPAMAMEAAVDPALLSHDPEVARAYAQDPLVGKRFTVRWSTETLAAQAETVARAGELRIPCLLLQAGDDQIADPTVSRAFFDRLTTPDREWREYEGFYHEIFNEPGRDRVFQDLGEWLEKRL
jgi:alpha-beta hydrolase superfamily lysophospholipase